MLVSPVPAYLKHFHKAHSNHSDQNCILVWKGFRPCAVWIRDMTWFIYENLVPDISAILLYCSIVVVFFVAVFFFIHFPRISYQNASSVLLRTTVSILALFLKYEHKHWSYWFLVSWKKKSLRFFGNRPVFFSSVSWDEKIETTFMSVPIMKLNPEAS